MKIDLEVHWIGCTNIVDESDAMASGVGKVMSSSNATFVFTCPEPSSIEPMLKAKVISLANDELENFFQLAKSTPIALILIQPNVKEIQAALY